MRVLHFCNSFMVSSWCCLVPPFCRTPCTENPLHFRISRSAFTVPRVWLNQILKGHGVEPVLTITAFLPLCRGEGKSFRTFTHQAVDQSVEQDFQLSAHVAPITRRSDDEGIGLYNFGEGALGIVLWQDAVMATAATHAASARVYV